jgi:hypothetical protein
MRAPWHSHLKEHTRYSTLDSTLPLSIANGATKPWCSLHRLLKRALAVLSLPQLGQLADTALLLTPPSSTFGSEAGFSSAMALNRLAVVRTAIMIATLNVFIVVYFVVSTFPQGLTNSIPRHGLRPHSTACAWGNVHEPLMISGCG